MSVYIKTGWNWNDIFLQKGKNSSEYRDRNQEIYDSVKEEQYATLDACVTHAIKEGNHTAFVHFFIEKARKQKSIFLKVLSEYLEDYEKVQKQNELLSNWEEFQLLHSEYWRSLVFDLEKCTVEQLEKYIYKSGILKFWKNIQYDNIPDKDAIVQCCLYLGRNAEETNRLLIAAGCSKLYVLDIVDAVSIYYLNKYERNFEITGLEKLKETRKMIRKGLEESIKEDENLRGARGTKKTQLLDKTLDVTDKLKERFLTKEEEKVLKIVGAEWKGDKVILKNIKNLSRETKAAYGIEDDEHKNTTTFDGKKKITNIYFKKLASSTKEQDVVSYLLWTSKDGYIGDLYRFEKKEVVKIGENSAIGLKIEEEIEKYRKLLEQVEENQRDVTNTDYLTMLYQDKLLEEYDIEAYIKNGKIKDNEDEIKWILKQKRYGYLKKTLQYLKEYTYYMKNLQYSPCELIVGFHPVSIEELKQRGRFIDASSGNFAKWVKSQAENKEEVAISRYLGIVNGIWKIKNAINEVGYEGWNDADTKNKGQFKVKSLIEGRNLLNERGYQLETENGKKEKVYVMDSMDKLSLMKYVVATGREDEVGAYLKCADFWEKDLTMVKDVELKELAERTELVFLYALRYRDALLEQWAEKSQMDKKIYINEARKEFPFIKLLMIINRDIQFVNDRIKIKQRVDSELKKSLIYPVDKIYSVIE